MPRFAYKCCLLEKYFRVVAGVICAVADYVEAESREFVACHVVILY